MKIEQRYLINNDVYTNNLGRIDNRYVTFQDEGAKGLVLHSVGTPQPKADVFIQRWNKPGVEKAAHAFIESGAVYQTLPWNYRGWHAGGTANNTHIGVEMTEPATIKYTDGSSWVDLNPTETEAFVRKTYANAVELFADLCKQLNLDPLADGVIISHKEGYKRGVASNHGDPEHIWSKFGLNMDLFRAAVAEKLRADAAPTDVRYRVIAGVYTDAEAAKTLARSLIAGGFPARVLDAADREVPLYRIGTVKVNTSLRIRSGPGTNYAITGKLKNGDKVTFGAEDNGWGELQRGGWVCLQYIV